jgi:hypothetical protein
MTTNTAHTDLGRETAAAVALVAEADHDYGVAVDLAALLEVAGGDLLTVTTEQRGGQTLVVVETPAGEFTLTARKVA